MIPRAPLSLDSGWRAEYFELEPDVYEFADVDGLPVPSLQRWRCEQRYTEGWAAYLQRSFDLDPIENECLRFELVIERAPAHLVLYLNGRRLGEIDGRTLFRFDITDYVTLEDNRIGLRVTCADCAARGCFGRVSVIAVPCDPHEYHAGDFPAAN